MVSESASCQFISSPGGFGGTGEVDPEDAEIFELLDACDASYPDLVVSCASRPLSCLHCSHFLLTKSEEEGVQTANELSHGLIGWFSWP